MADLTKPLAELDSTKEIATTVEFLRAVENLALRYLAVGDQAYTAEGLTLQDMFKRFSSDGRLLQDFCAWAGKSLE